MAKTTVVKMLPWSWHKSPGYRGQLERIERWYARSRQTKDLREIEDYLYAFFQGCHHLREWLPEEEFSSQLVSQFLAANVELQVCRDLANLTKHCELDRRPATAAEPSVMRVYAPSEGGWFGSDAALVVMTDVSDVPFDLLELAHRCLVLWSAFLSMPNPAFQRMRDGAAEF